MQSARYGGMCVQQLRGVAVIPPGLAKSNLAEKPPSLSYKIVTSSVYDTARIEWTGVTDHDANS